MPPAPGRQNRLSSLRGASHQPDRFTLRYLRFKCRDVPRTLEFYQNLGMSVEWTGDQVVAEIEGGARGRRVSRIPPVGRGGGAAGGAVKGGLPTVKEGLGGGGPTLPNGSGQAATSTDGSDKINLVALSYRSNTKTASTASNVLLVFEKEPEDKEMTRSMEDLARAEQDQDAAAGGVVDGGSAKDRVRSGGGGLRAETSTGDGDTQAGQAAQPLKSLPRPPLTAAANLQPTRIPHNYEYLVIYVHFLARLVKRLASKSFTILFPPQDIADVKMSIVRDPNGIEVRLMELTESQLNMPSNRRQQWYARLAYYALPTHSAEGSVRWYESVLGTHAKGGGRGVGGLRLTTLDLVGGGSPSSRTGSRPGGTPATMGTPGPDGRPISRKKPGAAATVRQAISQGQGFRLVDTEDFIVGLSRSAYYWLGNDLRSSTCTLCFTEHADFGSSPHPPPTTDTHQSHTTNKTKDLSSASDRKSSKLLSIGFEVPNLDAASNQLRYEYKDDLEWAHTRFRINGIGTVGKLFDKVNKVWIELFCAKSSERAGEAATRGGLLDGILGSNGGGMAADDNGSGGGVDGVGGADGGAPRIRKPRELAIDFSHLGGMARTLSEGALYRVKRPEDMDITVTPAPVVEVVVDAPTVGGVTPASPDPSSGEPPETSTAAPASDTTATSDAKPQEQSPKPAPPARTTSATSTASSESVDSDEGESIFSSHASIAAANAKLPFQRPKPPITQPPAKHPASLRTMATQPGKSQRQMKADRERWAFLARARSTSCGW
ncbi:hypothetical protein DFS34DRAFT_124336 [Phlyctochytrium arcticum]|nr:hypothetical protein DFS34DRAFT_124336 [Phlyctochytrium arcticum]